MENLEKTQMFFFKNLFNWQRNTPNYIVRRETNQPKLELEIFKRSTKWWLKLLGMNDDRYPKICYFKLRSLDRNATNVLKYNWVSQYKTLLSKIGYD